MLSSSYKDKAEEGGMLKFRQLFGVVLCIT